MKLPNVDVSHGHSKNVGEDNPKAKLKEWNVRSIRFVMAITADPQRSLRVMSKQYGVHIATLTEVWKRHTWRHI